MPRLADGSNARTFVTAVGALALAYLVVLATAWELGGTTRGGGPLSLVPEDPEVTYAQAIDELRASKGAALPDLLARVDSAADLDPLDGRPLFLHALEQVLIEGTDPSIGMLEASRKQSPRLAETRLLLLYEYGRNGRASDAIGEAQSLMHLMRPKQQSLVLGLIANLAQREGASEALARALPESAVRGDVMLKLAQTGANPALLERFAEPMRGLAARPAEREWIGELIAGVARRPDPAAARSLWAIFYNVDPTQVGTTVWDPQFKQGAGNPPFGWTFAPGDAGIAEPRNGALEVYYYGRDGAQFASQMLMLPPGDYVLSGSASSTDAEAPRGLAWQVGCVEGGPPRGSAALRDLMIAAFPGVRFSIPASGCSAQVLQLVGTPSDLAQNQSARIERVTIERAGP